MTDLETAIERLTAWTRAFGAGKSAVFIHDLSVVVDYAREKMREDAEIDRIVNDVVTNHPKDPKTTPIGRLRTALGMEGGSIGEVIERAIQAIEATQPQR